MKRLNPKESFLPILSIVIYVLLLGSYAIYLNHVYYSKYSPFDDSMSYMNQLAIIMNTANHQGFLVAMGQAVGAGTVFFPWLEGALLGTFFSPMRADGVLVQLPLILIQAISAYLYFRLIPKYSKRLSVVFAFVLISYSAIFFYNGGLSDFRMDLSQALAIGAALPFFIIARQTQELKFWILFSLMLSVSFLVRATTPVYAVLLFGTIFLCDLYFSGKNYLKVLKPYLVALTLVAVLTTWFFILNFDYLYYYYFIWNDDANAALPISESARHLHFLLNNNVGKPFIVLGIVVFLSQLLWNFNNLKLKISKVNWAMLFGGVVPVAFLILFGTAINPFVSMASVPGLLMFFLAPLNNVRSNKPLEKVLILLAIISIGFNVFYGYQKHIKLDSYWVASNDGIKAITYAITQDMQKTSRSKATYEMTFMGTIGTYAILNSLIYDDGFAVSKDWVVSKSDVSLTALQMPGLANHREWQDLPGGTPVTKLSYLVSEAKRNADYLIVPEDGTEFIPHHALSPYAIELRDMLIQTGSFERVSEPIKISDVETVSIYKNKWK